MIAFVAFPSIYNDQVLIVKDGWAGMDYDQIDGKKNMTFNCTPDQFLEGLEKYKKGLLMQDAFDFLTDEEREFLMSGLYADEFDKMFREMDNRACPGESAGELDDSYETQAILNGWDIQNDDPADDPREL